MDACKPSRQRVRTGPRTDGHDKCSYRAVLRAGQWTQRFGFACINQYATGSSSRTRTLLAQGDTVAWASTTATESRVAPGSRYPTLLSTRACVTGGCHEHADVHGGRRRRRECRCKDSVRDFFAG